MKVFVDTNIFIDILLNRKDFVKASQSAMAIGSGCDCIVTRNVNDFKKLRNIEVLEPMEFLNKFRDS